MTTKEKLEQNLKDAMRSNNELHKRVIRLALSTIKLEEVNKGKPLEEVDVLNVLQKEIKMRRESIDGAQKANRPDLIPGYQEEIEVLSTYLPKQLTQEELRSLVQEAIRESGAAAPADMGKVMKVLLPRVQGQIPNSEVSQVVRELLSS